VTHGFRLPDRTYLPAIFDHLAIAEEDQLEILAAWPSPDIDPDTWRSLERAYRTVVTDMGGFHPLELPGPLLAVESTPLGRYFFAYVYLAALADVRLFHARRGIPDDISETSAATSNAIAACSAMAVSARVAGSPCISAARSMSSAVFNSIGGASVRDMSPTRFARVTPPSASTSRRAGRSAPKPAINLSRKLGHSSRAIFRKRLRVWGSARPGCSTRS